MVPDRAVLMQDENQREIATVNYTRQEVGARRRKVFNTMPWAQKRRQEPRQKTISNAPTNSVKQLRPATLPPATSMQQLLMRSLLFKLHSRVTKD